MGNFMGYISLVHGPLGSVQIISDHSLTTDNGLFIIIKAIYLDKNALYLVISVDNLAIHEFNNGHWANSVMRVKTKE